MNNKQNKKSVILSVEDNEAEIIILFLKYFRDDMSFLSRVALSLDPEGGYKPFETLSIIVNKLENQLSEQRTNSLNLSVL